MIEKIFEDLKKEFKSTWDDLLRKEARRLKEMYSENINNKLNVKKKNWSRGISAYKIYNQNKNKLSQLNIFPKHSKKIIEGNFDKLISKSNGKKLLIRFSFIHLTKREFNNMLNEAERTNSTFVKDDILYILLNSKTRKYIRKIVRNSIKNAVSDITKQELSKSVRGKMKELGTVPVPVGVFKTETKRKDRININQLKNKMSNYLLSKVK